MGKFEIWHKGEDDEKVIYILLLIVPLMMGVMFYLDKIERDSSYSTPVEALENVKNSPWEVIEIIDTLKRKSLVGSTS